MFLKNEEVDGTRLLLMKHDISTCAVVGHVANFKNNGDKGSSLVRSLEVVSPYEGLRTALGKTSVLLDDSDTAEGAPRVASQCDLAVLFVGYDAADEGEYLVPSYESNQTAFEEVFPTADNSEATTRVLCSLTQDRSTSATNNDFLAKPVGGDRVSIRLRKQDVMIINATVRANANTIVIVVAGGATIINELVSNIPCVLMGWYNDCENGNGLADVLLGLVNPSGHLPWPMPKSEDHLTYFDPNLEQIQYDSWFGQRLIDRLEVAAEYSLGYGLSYTTFAFSGLTASL